MDPYRAPQPPPSPPRDAMRPVLIGAGAVAALLAVAAIVLGVMEKRERDEAEAPPPPKPPMSERMTQAQQTHEEVAHDDTAPPPIPASARGNIVVDGAVHGDVGPKFSSNPFDFTFAIFPANDTSANAVAILATKNGHGEAKVPNGRYDLCWSGRYPRDPYPQSRADWSAGCLHVLASPFVHVSANVGQMGPAHIFFECAPEGACPK